MRGRGVAADEMEKQAGSRLWGLAGHGESLGLF